MRATPLTRSPRRACSGRPYAHRLKPSESYGDWREPGAAPTTLSGLMAGPVVDRFTRQHLMVGADIARALLTVTIPFLALRWLPGVFVVVFLVATASAFFNPAKQAIIPTLVPNKMLVK